LVAAARAVSRISRCSKRSTGTSIGALVGACYAAGLSGKDLRRHVIALAHDRAETWRRLITARAGTLANLFAMGFGSATLIDAEKMCERFLPETLPQDFADLQIPLVVIATDLYRRTQMAFSTGVLRPTLAASIALPTVVRPVVVDERVFIDGGATNPLPFDHLRGRADVVVAVDISGAPNESRRDIPNPWECMLTTVLVMGNAITNEKLKHGNAPDLMIRPNVGLFRTLDFFHASAILRAAEPCKDEVKARLGELLE
jgi:NTE family protein